MLNQNKLCRRHSTRSWEKLTCPPAASQAEVSSPCPPSPVLKPPSRHAVPSQFDTGVCDQPTCGHLPAELMLCKELLREELLCHWPRVWAPEQLGKWMQLFPFVRGKGLFFAIRFCSDKDISSASWSLCCIHCLLNFYLSCPKSPLCFSRLISLRYSSRLDICTQSSLWGVGGPEHQLCSLLWFLSFVLFGPVSFTLPS